MSLPYPDMVFTPFDPLTAEEMMQMVANIEALQDWSAFEDGSFDIDLLPDGGLTTAKVGDEQITLAKIAPEEWTDWEPEIGASGSMTVSSIQYQRNRYIKVGRTVHFVLVLGFTLGGSASASVTFSLPETIYNTGQTYPFSAFVQLGTSIEAGISYYSSGTGLGTITRSDGSSWTTGSSRRAFVFGTYEVAAP